MTDSGKIVDAKLNPQINELQRQLALAQQQNRQGYTDAQRGYEFLARSATGNARAIDSAYNNARTNTDASYANLQKSLQNLYGQASNNTASEMQRLGLNQGVDRITQQNDTDRNLLMGLAQNRQAAADSTLNSLKSTFHSGALQGGEIARSTGRRTMDELNRALANLSMEYNGKISDLRASRPGMIEEQDQRNLDAQLKMLQLQKAKADMEAAAAGPSAMDQYEAIIAKAKADDALKGHGGQAAFDYLREAANGDEQQAADLRNIFTTLQSGNYNVYKPLKDDPSQKKWQRASGFGYDNPDTLQHLKEAAARHTEWGPGQLEALQEALRIYFDK